MAKLRSTIKGFTLVELMITLAIAVILLGLAAPSFVDIIKDNRLTTQINTLSASLNFARSEAIKRSVTVTVCKSNNGTTCDGNWQDGWIVFQDLNDIGVVNPAPGTNNDEPIIRISSALTSGSTLVLDPNIDWVTYKADGFAIDSKTIFKLCDDRGPSKAKGLVVSNTGRVKIAEPSELGSCT